jgi:hypothetical protein
MHWCHLPFFPSCQRCANTIQQIQDYVLQRTDFKTCRFDTITIGHTLRSKYPRCLRHRLCKATACALQISFVCAPHTIAPPPFRRTRHMAVIAVQHLQWLLQLSFISLQVSQSDSSQYYSARHSRTMKIMSTGTGRLTH